MRLDALSRQAYTGERQARRVFNGAGRSESMFDGHMLDGQRKTE